MLRCLSGRLLALTVALMAAPAIAGDANFSEFTLARSSTATVIGRADGSFPLPSIAKTDGEGNPCIGYATPNPDHIMVLEEDLPQLQLEVDSNDKDSTLVVRGPDNTIFCNFGTSEMPDARIEASNLKEGRYEIWVGSIEPDQNWNYRLSASAE